MQILIISLSSFKNILLSTPLINAIKEKHPLAKIHFVSLQQHSAYLNKVNNIEYKYYIKQDAIPVIFELLKINFNYIIDIEQTFRSYIITKSLKNKYNSQATVITYPKHKFLNFANIKNIYANKNFSKNIIDACKALQLNSNNLILKYCTNTEDELKKDDIPTSHSLGYITITLNNINLSTQNLITFCTELQFPIILIGTQSYFTLAESIKQHDVFKIYNSCGKYSEAEIYHLYNRSKLNIASEQISTLIAASTQKPLLYIGKIQPQINTIEPYSNFNTNFYKHNFNTLVVNDVQYFLNKK